MLRCLFLAFLIVFTSTLLQAETIITVQSGSVYTGEIVSESDSEIVLKTEDNVLITIYKDKVIERRQAKSVIHTNSGKTYTGEIISNGSNLIKIKASDGIIIEIPQEEVFKITPESAQNERDNQTSDYSRYGQPRQSNSNNNTYSLYNRYNNTLYTKEHVNFGVGFIIPAGINLVIGYTTDNIGFRVQGGYWSSIYGLQGNLLFNIIQKSNFEVNLGLCAGISATEENYSYGYYNTYTHMGGICLCRNHC